MTPRPGDAARPGPNFDVDRATQAYLDILSPEQRKLSDRYFEGGYWLQVGGFVYGLGIAAIFLGANELRIGESVCRGDSGGPRYALSSGALIAVSSRGRNGPPETNPWSPCVGSATINYFTRTDSFAALIKQTVHQTGELLWEEGQPRPEQPSVTLRTCADASSCGAGYECGDGYCLRLPEPEKPVEQAPAAQRKLPGQRWIIAWREEQSEADLAGRSGRNVTERVARNDVAAGTRVSNARQRFVDALLKIQSHE